MTRSMRFFAVTACCLSSTAFAGVHDRLPPEAYVDPADQRFVRGEGPRDRPVPCGHWQPGATNVSVLPAYRCVRMLPTLHWKGLWRAEYNGSRFCPAPATTCDDKSKGYRIWFDNDLPVDEHGKLFAVDFMGRQTKYKGPYGYQGTYDYEVVADRMISIRKLSQAR